MADDVSDPSSAHSNALEALVVMLLMGAALVIRVLPFGEMSLWWDELVHLQTASIGGFLDVLRAVKDGVPPGFGNAGAVPADYLLLNAWLRVAPEPTPEWIEEYYRVPALAWSVLTVGMTYAYGRRFFDRGIGLVAATLVAFSVSHSLYAAEVRNYSLFGLMTVVNLYAFSALVGTRRSIRSWVAYTVVAVVYFGSGLMSLLVVLGQYVVLAVLLVRDAMTRPEESRFRGVAQIGFPLASGLVLLTVVAIYLHGTFLGVQYGRPTENLDTWERTYAALQFFAGGNTLLLYAFAAGVILFPLNAFRRDLDRFSIALGMLAAFLAIPTIVEIERMKEYYFHPRHAFFLFPIFAIVAAGGILGTVRELDLLGRTRIRTSRKLAAYTSAAAVLALTSQLIPLAKHLENPKAWFQRSKTLRQYNSLAQHLQRRIEALEDDQVYLLIAERRLPGHIGNPMLAKYLEWYDLDDRVVLRGTDVPNQTRIAIASECPDGCVGERAMKVQTKLHVTGPFNSRREILDLVEVSPSPQTRAPVGALGLLQYWRLLAGPPARAPRFDVTTHVGMSLFEKPGRAER